MAAAKQHKSYICREGFDKLACLTSPHSASDFLQRRLRQAQSSVTPQTGTQLAAGSRRLSYKKTIKGSGTHCVDLLRSNLAAEQHSNEVLGVWEQQSNICDFSVLKTIKNLAAFTRSAWSCRACNTLHSCNSSLSWLSLWSLRSSTDSQEQTAFTRSVWFQDPQVLRIKNKYFDDEQPTIILLLSEEILTRLLRLLTKLQNLFLPETFYLEFRPKPYLLTERIIYYRKHLSFRVPNERIRLITTEPIGLTP